MITIPENELMIFGSAVDELFDGERSTVEEYEDNHSSIDNLTCLLSIESYLSHYSLHHRPSRLYHCPGRTIIFVSDNEVLSTSKPYTTEAEINEFLSLFMSAVHKPEGF